MSKVLAGVEGVTCELSKVDDRLAGTLTSKARSMASLRHNRKRHPASPKSEKRGLDWLARVFFLAPKVGSLRPVDVRRPLFVFPDGRSGPEGRPSMPDVGPTALTSRARPYHRKGKFARIYRAGSRIFRRSRR